MYRTKDVEDGAARQEEKRIGVTEEDVGDGARGGRIYGTYGQVYLNCIYSTSLRRGRFFYLLIFRTNIRSNDYKIT